ncbi:MAG: flagellar biosynthetic protein FliO [Desulfarculaceae bacterium]
MKDLLQKALTGLAFGLGPVLGPGLAWAADADTSPLPAGDLSGAMAKVIFGLALVLLVMAALYWLVKRFAPKTAAAGQGRMRLLGRLGLGPRKFVALVEVGEKVLVLGVGGDNVRLLTTLDDPGQVAGLKTPQGAGFVKALKKAAGLGEDES